MNILKRSVPTCCLFGVLFSLEKMEWTQNHKHKFFSREGIRHTDD